MRKLFLVGLVVCAACSVPVESAPASDDTVFAEGEIVAKKEVRISADRYYSVVQKIHVKEGRKVKKGKVLVTLERPSTDPYDLTREWRRRWVDFWDGRGIRLRPERLMRDDVDEWAEYWRDELDETTDLKIREEIKAPFAGTIIEIACEEGEQAGDEPIILLADVSRLYVEAWVEEVDANEVEKGQDCTVTVNGDEYEGEVIKVAKRLVRKSSMPRRSAVMSSSKVREIRVELDEEVDLDDVLLGSPVEVFIEP